ncbi:MAG: transcriptional regulator, LuxR family [Conexibacter sp.]|nr:transcriptional regulator, LuxR family [Conexibacter sp.]
MHPVMARTSREMALIERDGELSALQAALERAAGGDGVCVVVEGAPGIGKTALLRAAAARARATGMTVLRARGGELERDLPHGVARQLLERAGVAGPLTGAAALAAPALGLRGGPAPGPGEAEFALTHGLYWLVANLAEGGPLALVVDDLHWADGRSLHFLLYLARRLEDLPVAILAGARPGSPRDDRLVAELLAVPDVEIMRPRELSEAGSADWVRSELTGADPEFASACHTASGGNPFLLGELLESLRADGIVPDEAGANHVPTVSPRGVSHAILLRLAQLPPAATRLARAVVALGEDVELRHAAVLAGVDDGRAAELADALSELHVLADGRPVSVIHPVVGEAIRDDMRAGDAAALHAKAARLLGDDGRPPDRVAPHLMLSDAAGDPWVVRTLRDAAALARTRGAAETARRWLERALAEGVADDRAALLAELGEAEWLCGRPAEGVDHLRAALSGAPDDEASARSGLVLARALASTAQVAGATTVLREILDDAPGIATASALRIEAELATYGLLSGLPVDAIGANLERFASLEGEGVADLLTLCSLAITRVHTAAAPDAVAVARRGLAGDRLLAAGESCSFPYVGAVVALCVADDHDEARAQLGRAIDNARARGSSVAFGYACCMAAMLAWMAGDVRRCEAFAREAIDPGIPTGFAHPVLHAYLALASIERGDLEGAEAAIEGIEHGPNPSLFTHSSETFCARAPLRRAQGRIEEAAADARELAGRAYERVRSTPHPPWRLEAAECLLAIDAHDEARELLEEQATHARRWGARSAIGAVERVRALAAPPGDRIALLRQAVSTLAASPARLEHARALVDLGAALRAAKRRTEARERLRDAVEEAARCGAVALQRRAHEELVAAGARPQRQRFSGADSLTASERRVAELAVNGLTNSEIAQALFVTRSTVEKHLSHSYEKLEIGSRDELPAALAN